MLFQELQSQLWKSGEVFLRMERISVAVGKRYEQHEILFPFIGFVWDPVAEAQATPWCLVA